MTFLLGVFLSSAVCLGQGFEGTIEFSTEEKEAHRRNIDTILRVARTYLEDIWKEHLAFYRQHGVSKFYGDRNLSLDIAASEELRCEQLVHPHRWSINYSRRVASD